MTDESPADRGARMMREAGYGAMDGVKAPAVPRKSGGRVKGDMAEARPDRRARGGSMPKGKGKPVVNIKIGGQKGPDPKEAAMAGMQMGAKLGARAAASKMMAGAGGPPPGGMPTMPPGGPGGGPPPGPGGPPMMPPGGGGGPPGVMRRGGAMKRASGGSIERELKAKQKADKAEPAKDDDPASDAPDSDNSDDRKRGGSVKVREHERRRAGGAL